MKTKLLIFRTVAYHLSFTKAAEQLYLSQPAVSKSIRKLEEEYQTTFFLRKRNSIELTEEGKSFLIYVEKILTIYDEMDDHFLNLQETLPELIRFGASTTLASYIFPGIIAKFRTQYPRTSFQVESGNSEEIEDMILHQQLDFGVTEGRSTHRKLQYKQFIKDEIVLVTNIKNNSARNDTMNLKQLQEIPMVDREQGSGTREIINDYLTQKGVSKLNTVATLGSTEAIKHYLYYSDSYALLSIHAVNEDLISHRLRIVDIKNVAIERWFYFVSRTGYHSKVMDLLVKFIRSSHNY